MRGGGVELRERLLLLSLSPQLSLSSSLLL